VWLASNWPIVIADQVLSYYYRSFLCKMWAYKLNVVQLVLGTDGDMQWYLSQVKGTIEEDVTEGKYIIVEPVCMCMCRNALQIILGLLCIISYLHLMITDLTVNVHCILTVIF